ncbi:MAG: glycosyltransferase family 2 protein [Bacteroidota bacterium]
MHDDKLVTVCITTYNRKEMLNQAVESVLAQTYLHFELIIVDDCSADGTKEYVHANLLSKDRRIRYIRHEVNKGLAAARNTAIFNGKGTYFAFVDDDDRWGKEYLEEFVSVARQYDSQWCFCCGCVCEDVLGQTIFRKYAALEGKLFDYCKEGLTPPVASQFYYRDTLVEAGGYNENVRSGVDHDLWLTLAFRGVSLKSVDKYLSQPSDPMDVGRVKMTNSYQKRMQGIEKSLNIWREAIVNHYGEEYYHKFYRAYSIREKKKFFRLNMMRFNFIQAFQLYRDIKQYLSGGEILKSAMISIFLFLNISVKRTKYYINQPGFAPFLK